MIPVPHKSREAWYIAIGGAELLACLGFVLWTEVGQRTEDSFAETIIAAAIAMEALVVVLGTATVIIMEGGAMLAEKYLRRRYAEGTQQGKAEEYARWEAWNRRRLEAERAGRDFNEPPPAPPAGLRDSG